MREGRCAVIEQLLDSLAETWVELAPDAEKREAVIAMCAAMSYTQLLNFSTMFTQDCLSEHVANPRRLILSSN